MHIRTTPHPPKSDHAASSTANLRDAVRSHRVTAEHPPTITDAASDLWPDRNHVRYGLAGQLAAAAAAVIQLAGLAACWATAHVLFATRTRAAIFAAVLSLTLTAFAIASHT